MHARLRDGTDVVQRDAAGCLQLRPVAGPPNLPAPLVTTLAEAIVGAMQDPKVVAWAAAIGARMDAKGPQETVEMLRQQTLFIEKWKSVLTPV